MLLAFVLYALLASGVTVHAGAVMDGLRGITYLEICFVGLCFRTDGRFGGGTIVCAAKRRFLKKNTETEAGSAGKRRILLLLRAMRLRYADVLVRMGLTDAQQTALAAGAMDALARGLVCAFEGQKAGCVRIVPEYGSSCFLLEAHCIFSARAGDIVFAGIRGMMKNRSRREGSNWRSIPLNA